MVCFANRKASPPKTTSTINTCLTELKPNFHQLDGKIDETLASTKHSMIKYPAIRIHTMRFTRFPKRDANISFQEKTAHLPFIVENKVFEDSVNYIYIYKHFISNLIICSLASKLKHLAHGGNHLTSQPHPTPSHRSGPPARPLHSWQVRSSILPNNLRKKRHILESRPCWW